MKVNVECGTVNRIVLSFDTDEFDNPVETNADQTEIDEALNILIDTIGDSTFTKAHRRNNAAVNSCIALHVLGYYPKNWFEEFFCKYEKQFSRMDVIYYMDHVRRVCDYLESWGPAGNEVDAFDYCI